MYISLKKKKISCFSIFLHFKLLEVQFQHGPKNIPLLNFFTKITLLNYFTKLLSYIMLQGR